MYHNSLLGLLPGKQTTSLSRNLNPSEYFEVGATEIFYNIAAPAIAPKGGHLMTSLILATFGCWLNEDNHAFMRKRDDNYAPFLNIWHAIQPSFGVRGAVLNPEKVGLVYCMILRGVFLQPTWPGHIHVDIMQKAPRSRQLRALGELDI